MFGALLEPIAVCVREGVEVALVVGIFLAYLQRTGRLQYARAVYAGVAASLLASIGIGAALWVSGFNPDNPALEGVLMLLAAMLVGSLLVWMWRAGRAIRRTVEQRLDAIFTQAQPVKFWTTVATFSLIFVMVLREGVETVVFLLALAGSPGTNPWFTAAGSCIGIVLAGAVGVLLARGSARINLRRFFAVTGFALALLVLKLVAGAVHELLEAGLIVEVHQLELIADFLTSRSVSVIILVVIVAAPLVCLAFDAMQRSGPKPASGVPS